MAVKVSKEMHDLIRSKYVAGQSISGIARELGFTKSTIYHYCYGLEKRPVGSQSPISEEMRDLIRAKYVAGQSFASIGKELGVSSFTAHKYCSGLNKRSAGLRRIPQEMRDLIRAKYVAGQSFASIGKELGISNSSVERICSDLDKRPQGRPSLMTQKMRDLIQQSYLQGQYPKEFSKKYKVSLNKIYRVLEDVDIIPCALDGLAITEDDFSIKKEIVDLWQDYCKTTNKSAILATEEFCANIKNGKLRIPKRIKQFLSSKKGAFKLSRASLYVWQSQTSNS